MRTFSRIDALEEGLVKLQAQIDALAKLTATQHGKIAVLDNVKNPYTICYTSKSRGTLNPTQLKDLFEQVIRDNKSFGIMGILLHSYGTFFQVMEGEKGVLLKLYEDKIKNDHRHSEIFEVFNKASSDFVFKKYSSEFRGILEQDQLEEVLSYLDRQESTSSTADKIARLLKPFKVDGEKSI